MPSPSRSFILRHPQHIHPSLWRASQGVVPARHTVSTGHPQLDSHLLGGGWPLGTFIELLSAHAGAGEIQLLGPALLHARSGGRLTVLINPPHLPSSTWLDRWLGRRRPLLWLRPQTTADALWASQTVLEQGACASLLCWIDTIHAAGRQRLHLAARRADTLFFALRPLSARARPSLAPLRLQFGYSPDGLEIHILKQHGPAQAQAFTLPLHHGPLDQRTPAATQPA